MKKFISKFKNSELKQRDLILVDVFIKITKICLNVEVPANWKTQKETVVRRRLSVALFANLQLDWAIMTSRMAPPPVCHIKLEASS